MIGTGCNVRNRKEKGEDIVSMCIIFVNILLFLIVNITG